MSAGGAMNKREMRLLIRNIVIELIGYGILVVLYAAFAVPLVAEPLARLFGSNLVAYALVGLGLIVAQGLVLDVITSFLVNQLRLDRLE
jgi:hypothetical protein